MPENQNGEMTIWNGSAVLPMHKVERSILESMITVML